MKNKIGLLMLAVLTISILAVLPIPVKADPAVFTYSYTVETKPDFAFVGKLAPGEWSPWVEVSVGIQIGEGEENIFPVYQYNGWVAEVKDRSGNVRKWAVKADPAPPYTWDNKDAVVTVRIQVQVPENWEEECDHTFNVKLKPGSSAAKKSVGSGDGVHFKVCITGTSYPPQDMVTVTFDQVGVGDDFTGIVLTVDGTEYGVSDLPVSFMWDVGSKHDFAYGSPLNVGDCKRYVWDSTSGLSTAQSGTITVPSGGGTVTAYYHTEYYLTVRTDPEGLVKISGEDWYKEGTDVELTAPEVEGYIFVYWDVDGTPVEGNPITVTMDTCHTATAHYWPELEYEQFVTDSSFNVIDSFRIVWTPKDAKKTMFKLASTNPGQFYLNIKITNTWPEKTGPIRITFTLDDDFVIRPVQGNPVQVWTGYGLTGTRVPATITYDSGSGMVMIEDLEPGQTVYVTVHMEYKYKGQDFTKAEMQNWKNVHPSNTFSCGYAVTVPGPFPFEITSETSTTIYCNS